MSEMGGGSNPVTAKIRYSLLLFRVIPTKTNTLYGIEKAELKRKVQVSGFQVLDLLSS